MRRIILSAAALVIGLTVAGTAVAGPKGGGGSKGGSFSSKSYSNSHSMSSSYSSKSSSNYHMTYGSKFKGGYCYKGKDHCHWTHQCWWGSYGCYTYYCPSTCGWYYWYPQDCCYYPCSYVRYATPVCESAPSAVPTGVTQVVNVANNSPGSVSAGGTAAAGATPPPPPGK